MHTPPTTVDTDVSNVSSGGVLLQVQEGQQQAVAYLSKTLSRTGKNYCVTRQKLLAILKTAEQFHRYLYD